MTRLRRGRWDFWDIVIAFCGVAGVLMVVTAVFAVEGEVVGRIVLGVFGAVLTAVTIRALRPPPA